MNETGTKQTEQDMNETGARRTEQDMTEAETKQAEQDMNGAETKQTEQDMYEAGTKQAALDVIYLAACALHKQAPEKDRLDKIEWKELYRTAKRHSMTAVVCMALEAGNAFSEMEPSLVKMWQDGKNKSIRKTMLMDAEWRNIMGFMEDQGIWYMPLKGMVIKDLYPSCGMRQMADYDILIDPAGQKKLHAYMSSRGYKEKGSGTSVHNEYCKDPVYNFELHRALFLESSNSVWHDYYKNVKERLVPDEGFCYRFREEDFYVYLTAHACKHFGEGGTGLRSLMDCYVYCQEKRDMLDWHSVRAELETLGLTEFEQMCRELAFCLFPEPDPYFLDALTAEQRASLEYFIGSGTYGTAGQIIENRLRALQQDGNAVSTKTRLHYLWRRLVPDMAWFRDYAPFCYRHKWSIPFFMIYRVTYGLIFRRKWLRNEIQAVRKTK